MADEAAQSNAAPVRAPLKVNKVDPGYVKCRILKKGDKKVHRGGTAKSLSTETEKYDAETQELFPTFRFGDEVALPIKIAQAQEDNGHLEIMDA